MGTLSRLFAAFVLVAGSTRAQSVGLVTPAHAIDRADIGLGPFIAFPNPLDIFGHLRIPVKEKLDIGVKAGASLKGGAFLAQGDIKIPFRHDEPDLSILAVFDNAIDANSWRGLATGGLMAGHQFETKESTISPYGAITIGFSWNTSGSSSTNSNAKGGGGGFAGFGAIGCEFRVTKTVAPIIEIMLPFGALRSPVFLSGGVMFYF